jgi:hypothetical protein
MKVEGAVQENFRDSMLNQAHIDFCVFHDTWTVIPAETGRLFHGKLDSSIA